VWRSFATGLVVALVCNVALVSQADRYEFAGLLYRFPLEHSVAALRNDGTGVLEWSADVPTNTVMYTINASCPATWARYEPGYGRFSVGLPFGGVSAAQVGVSLGNQEDRVTGQHIHGATIGIALTGTHTHTINDPQHTHIGSWNTDDNGFDNDGPFVNASPIAGRDDTSTNATGISLPARQTGVAITAQSLTLQNTGAVANTNAPYLQLVQCIKL
jgi:hypothetical protein